jgi:16S rRNA (adenine1518-N6/adenine1519-N6)-dimethyltransferase
MRSRWGQNFLVSPAVCRRIVDALNPDPAARVVEIGPGKGALTEHLLPRVGTLTVVELDAPLAATLKARWGYHTHFHVENRDFLEWAPPPPADVPVQFIGNLPYSAAAAIVQKVLAGDGWDRAVFMVQKEVAERMTAQPGGRDWGLLALSVQSRARTRVLFHVPPGAFRPKPQVVSTVIELIRAAPAPVERIEPFFRVARAAFGQRRKNLLNSLSHGLGADKPAVAAILAAAGLSPTQRPETVDVEGFKRLTDLLIPGDVHAENVVVVPRVPENPGKGDAGVPRGQ